MSVHVGRKLERERNTATAALRNLADAVGAMKVPQTVEDAAMQIHITLGPALTAARKILENVTSEGPPTKTVTEATDGH